MYNVYTVKLALYGQIKGMTVVATTAERAVKDALRAAKRNWIGTWRVTELNELVNGVVNYRT